MVNPIVSIICLCYNHERFVRESIESVLNQTYQNIEIIVVDDASTDGSRGVIDAIVRERDVVKKVLLEKNVGLCSAFNIGWRMASGDFIVDFATDDVMLPERIEKQVNYFQKEGKECGVVFTDAIYIDEQGMEVRRHFDHLRRLKRIGQVPEGDVYANVVERFFIPAPTMLVRNAVMQTLNGYDENLSYEDFDFWVRSSRNFLYGFLDKPLTKIRLSGTSLSTKVYSAGDKQAYSTYLVCRKIAAMNRNSREVLALQQRLRYEFRHCVMTGNVAEGELFYELMRTTGAPDVLSRILYALRNFSLPLSFIRRTYHRLRYR